MELLDSSIKSILQNSKTDLKINEDVFFTDRPTVTIDVETDETPEHNIVGAALYNEGVVYYYTKSCIDKYKKLLDSCKLIGHNIKQDLHWLNIGLENVRADTMLMSYVLNPIKESHGLKQLAKEFLHFEYPSYKDIVGKGRKKKTLDKQEVEVVAGYCGLDTIATYRLYMYFMETMTSDQLKYFDFEMQIMKCLYAMECKGVTINKEYLEKLQDTFIPQIQKLEQDMTALTDEPIKYTSPIQVKNMLSKQGVIVINTKRSTLQDFEHLKLIQKLLKHRELSKLYSTYVKGILKLSTLPKIYTTFNQVSTDNEEDDWSGIRTGRLSSSKPNLHSIPTRTENGDLLRDAFIPSSCKHSLIVADYSQIEYRLLAHFSREPILVNAFRCGRDVHEETGKMFGVDRDIGKTLNFASIYGARSKKISITAKISIPEAKKLLDLYWIRLPFVKIWINQIKDQARKNGYIKTIVGRTIPIDGMNSLDQYERFKAERRAVNYMIQGSAADVIKIAMLQLQRKHLIPILQVHDELIFDVSDESNLEEIKNCIKVVMESAKELIIPIIVKIGIGKTWREAKQ